MFRKIAVLGMGLLGASLMQAARQRGLAGHLAAWARRAETRNGCAGQAWCDSVHELPDECVSGADLVVACVPVDKIAEVLGLASAGLKAGVLVTDVGSTKLGVCERVRAVLPEGARFVGSHPMTGSEKSGMSHANHALFEGRVCMVTPRADEAPEAVGAVTDFWRALGMRTVVLPPEKHDEVVGFVSHLPHFVSSALACALAQKPERWRELSGAGLRDTTRIAAGDSTMWRAISEENREQILQALDAYSAELAALRDALAREDWAALTAAFERGKAWRTGLG